MRKMKNILVDWHGPADYNRDFRELIENSRNEIDFYFYYDRRTGASLKLGKNTCLANCSHCFLKIKGAEEEYIPVSLAIKVANDLRTQGYTQVDLTPSDSFGEEILEYGDDGSAQRISGMGKMAWTSGTPLALSGWEKRLERAWQIGYRSLVINGHDLAGTTVPFTGVTKVPTLKKALANMKQWNEHNLDKQFDWGYTFTLRSDTCNSVAMGKIAEWAVENKIKVLRFNCFSDFLGGNSEYSHLVPSREDISTMYKTLAFLHEKYIDSLIQFSISEDFGDAGIEAIEHYISKEYRGKKVGICRAGWRLFAITPIHGVLRVVGCVDSMWPYLGIVRNDHNGNWIIEWDLDRIEKIRKARVKGQFYGCFGGVGRDRFNDAGFNTLEGNDLLSNLS